MRDAGKRGDLEVTVNGRTHMVQADPETPLLYVLRNELKLNAAKFGCGLAQCGACTVHVDGEPVRSCVLPVSEVAGAEVTTLEGLGTWKPPHPIQQAFLESRPVRYCIPGMMMSAAACWRRTASRMTPTSGRRSPATSAAVARTSASCAQSKRRASAQSKGSSPCRCKLQPPSPGAGCRRVRWPGHHLQPCRGLPPGGRLWSRGHGHGRPGAP